ncbi:amino acid permease [Streptomyces sp. NRRL F-5053]|uniref:amino acid permease n=1 Tax=Streptomyces sp. NRRL F-5053 TaxID=1463854 RepID=UPI000690FFD6|nr:amino acid permease [Streptomyces sp. NRRL F-5053]
MRVHRRGDAKAADDDADLRRLGIRPELGRRMSPFANFAISFSVISVLTGCLSMYGYGLSTGGPALIVLGWAAVGGLVLLIGLALAEITSAYPTAGGLYFMAEKLAVRHGERWGWYTGWFNLLGLLGAVAAIDYGAATFISGFIEMQWGHTLSRPGTFALFLGILVLHALPNLAPVRLVSTLNAVSAWWHLVGVTVIVTALAVVPSEHRSPQWITSHFVDDTGFHNPLYVAAIGLMGAQYTFCGYDASSHMAEETVGSRRSSARGIVNAILVSWIAGLLLLTALTASIGDYEAVQAADVPPVAIFIEALGTGGAKLMMLIVIGAMLFCGCAEVTATSRMVLAFSRRGAVPGHRVWARVHPHTHVPRAAVGFVVAVAALLALPALASETAFNAVVAINILGFYTACGIPIWLRLRHGQFTPGAWRLGRLSRPVGWLAVIWAAVVLVLACLPQQWPLTVSTLNYAPLALVCAVVLAAVTWRYHRTRTERRQLPAPASDDDWSIDVV